MSKEKSNEESIDWIQWFQEIKETNSFRLDIFLTVLSDFVKQHPRDARYLTIQDLHAILLDEI